MSETSLPTYQIDTLTRSAASLINPSPVSWFSLFVCLWNICSSFLDPHNSDMRPGCVWAWPFFHSWGRAPAVSLKYQDSGLLSALGRFLLFKNLILSVSDFSLSKNFILKLLALCWVLFACPLRLFYFLCHKSLYPERSSWLHFPGHHLAPTLF